MATDIVKGGLIGSGRKAAAPRLTREQRKNLILASLGSILEYYEFMVFGFLTVVIARLFFPPEMPETVRMFQTFVIFSLGFLVRPLAGAIVGYLGDKFGRRRLFLFTIFAMAVPTTLMGFLPTYAQIGIVAPILLLVLRLLQGIAVAGEFAGSAVFVTEHVPGSRIGAVLGWLTGASYLGFFLGAAMGALLASTLDPASLDTWGWRFAFIVGGVFGLAAVFLRRHLDETPLFQEIALIKGAATASPLKTLFRHHLKPALFVMGAALFLGIIFWLVYLYMPTLLQVQYKFARPNVVNANAAALLVLSIACVFWGWVADKIGTPLVLGIGAIASPLMVSLFFMNIDAVTANQGTLIWWYLAISFFVGTIVACAIFGALSFPTEVRFTGFGLAFNLGIVISSVTPAVLAWLVANVGKSGLHYVAAAEAILGVLLAIIAFRIKQYPRAG
jgi:MFS family permease